MHYPLIASPTREMNLVGPTVSTAIPIGSHDSTAKQASPGSRLLDLWPQAGRLWTALVCLLLASSCAPQPYYADYLFKPPKLVERRRSFMVIRLDSLSRSNRIKRIELKTPDGDLKVIYPRESGSPDIDWLPLPVLYATSFVLHPRYKGIEVDLIAHTEADGFVPVSVRYDIDDTVHLEMGKPMPSLLPAAGLVLTQKQLQQLYGVGPVKDRDRAWRPYELYALEQALSLLSADERIMTAELPFVREKRAKTAARGLKFGEIWAQYHGGRGADDPREIRLFDTIDGHDQSLFVGEPDHPRPLPTMCLLHEIAHAIADYPRIALKREDEQQLVELLQLNALWKTYNSQHRPDEAQVQALVERTKALSRARDELLVRRVQLIAQYQHSAGPVLAAYLAARGPERGPTKYGRTTVEESFAESFALFRADPAALERIYPDAYAWFAKGGHIQAVREALHGSSAEPPRSPDDAHHRR